MKNLIPLTKTQKSYTQSLNSDSNYISRIEFESVFNGLGLFSNITITFYPSFSKSKEEYYHEYIEPGEFHSEEDLKNLIKKAVKRAKESYKRDFERIEALKRQCSLF
jgi:hypothetical protein